MKRIAAIQDEVMKVHGITSKKDAVKYYCPKYFKCGEDMVDATTTFQDKTGQVVGCRYITCKKCWNKGVD